MTQTNSHGRFKIIKLDIPRACIFAEHLTDQTILKNSRLFCGCCGRMIGTVTQDIKFPFSTAEILTVMDNITIHVTVFGSIHSTCGNLLAMPGWGWHFHPLRDLFDLTFKSRETDRLLKSIPQEQDHV